MLKIIITNRRVGVEVGGVGVGVGAGGVKGIGVGEVSGVGEVGGEE